MNVECRRRHMPASCLAQTLTSSFTLLLCVRRASARVRPWRARLTDVLLHAACKQRPQPPSEEYPVAQSYVDVFIAGGFTLSDQFGKWCAEYTQLWGAPVAPATTSTVQAAGAGGAGAGAGAGSSDDSTSDAGEQASQSTRGCGGWVDDRLAPMYRRADAKAAAQAPVIDALLKSVAPVRFRGRGTYSGDGGEAHTK